MPVDYRVDPNQARTDLYGIGKGLAQVVDLSPTRRAAEISQARADKKLEDERAREENLIANISALGKGDVRPNDLGYFADKQRAVYDLAKNKFVKSKGNLSIDDQLEIEMAVNAIKQEAFVSKDAREQAEQYQKAAILNPEKYDDPTEVQAINDFLYNPGKAGQWGDMPTLTQRYDYGQHVIKDLLPAAEQYAAHNSQRGYEVHTIDQAKQMIANDLNDPIKFRQAAKDFKNAEDKLGAADPLDFYQKKFAPQLVINKTPQLQQWQVYGPGDANKKDIRVTHTVKDDEEEYAVQDPKTNEEVVLIKKDGNIVGGIKGGRLTPAEKSERDKAISFNNKAKAEYNKALNDIKEKAATEGWTVEEAAAALPVKPVMMPVPFKEKGIEIPAEEAQKIAYNKYGVDVDQIEGGGQEGVTVKRVDAKTKKESPAKPKTLSPATIKAKVGTKGFEGYTEKELIDYYKSQGYTIQ